MAGTGTGASGRLPFPVGGAMTEEAAGAKGRRRGRVVLWSGLVATVLVGVGWAGHHWLVDWRFRTSVDNAYVKAEMTPISALVAGRIAAVTVEDNQRVEAGAVVAVIDGDEFDALVAEALAALAERRAALESARLRHLRQQAVIAEEEAAGQAAAAALALADQELARASSLVARAVGTRQRLDEAEAARRRLAAEAARAQARHEIALRDEAILGNEVERLTAEVDTRQAALRLRERDLAEATIRAPVAGVIGNRQVRVGQYVRPGTLLMVVVPLAGVWVEANVTETDLVDFEPGMPASVEIDGFPDVRIRGVVDGLAPATGSEFSILPPQNATGNFTRIAQLVPVKILLPSGHPLEGLLRPGMSAVVTVDDRDRNGAGGARASP